MKKCFILNLMFLCSILPIMAKESIPKDNTVVCLKNLLLPKKQASKSPYYLPNYLPKKQPSSPASPLALTSTMISKEEIEPNNNTATANALGGIDMKVKGNISPDADIDYFSFTATANDRVYVATQTSFSATGSSDSFLELIGTNGTTVLESDDNDGSFGLNSSGIAGAIIPTSGTYYLRVRHILTDTKLLPYFLYFRLQSGLPTSEIEPNDTKITSNAFPNAGWVNGVTSTSTDVDFYSIALNAGDTIFLSLDFNPERDGTTWNGQIVFGELGGADLSANDTNATSPNSESFFLTVKTSGTYYISVRTLGSGNTFGSYSLSASVLPPVACTTYTSTNVPQTIPIGIGAISSTLTIPDNKRIDKIKVSINITHEFIPDLDIRLTSPSGNTVVLFTDMFVASPLNITLDDDAALPLGSFQVANDIVFQPPYKYRLEWFKGQPAQGTWTLTIDDDTGGNVGTLTSWGIEVCEEQPIAGTLTTIYSSDFETGDGGFSHSGPADEWERGNPTFAPVTGCNSGTNCWKTDLDNTYDFNSNTDLVSPNIAVPNISTNKAYLTWAQKFQMAGADNDNDNAYVEVQEVGGSGTTKRVWQWLGASMVEKFNYGNPVVIINEAAGWGVYRADISAFSGKTIKIIFHMDSNSDGTNLAGWAIDDVKVFKTYCPTTATETVAYNGVYTRVVASNTVTATNQVTNSANITYQAGKSILLQPNFKADSGTVFIAQIGGCN